MKKYSLLTLLMVTLVGGILLRMLELDQQVAGLRQQVAEASALRQQVNELAAELRIVKDKRPSTSPRVFEKAVNSVPVLDIYLTTPEQVKQIYDRGRLDFTANVGDIVVGDISVNYGNTAVVSVRDPQGNTIVKTDYVTQDMTGRMRYFQNSGFPWTFAFIAPATGEYALGIITTHWIMGSNQPSAKLKVTVYNQGLIP